MHPDRDVWKFGVVFFGLLAAFLVIPLFTSRSGHVCLNIFYASGLFYALWLTRPGRWGLLFGGILLIWRCVLSAFLSEGGASVFMESQYLIVLIVANLYIAGMLLVYVFCRRGSHGGVILAALTSYVLMGFILTDVFLLIELVTPGSFWVQPPGDGRLSWADAAAYSFHLLSPMGPPGVIATGLCARSVAIVGALLGFCYTAVLVSKIVNWAPLLKPKELSEECGEKKKG